jgi:hypothetical protein
MTLLPLTDARIGSLFAGYFPQLSLRLATSVFALRPEFPTCLTVQTLGVRLIGAGFGDRFLLVWIHVGTQRQLGLFGEQELKRVPAPIARDNRNAPTRDLIVESSVRDSVDLTLIKLDPSGV